MSGFQHVESKFAPIPDGTYTLFPTEATFIISSNKGTPGVNFKIKIDDLTEEGTPQPNAGKSFFLTKYLTDKTVGDFCQMLDAMGFGLNDQNSYLMPDGSLMPDFLKMTDKETVSFLVGVPFVGKLSSSDNKYTNDKGEEKESIQYNIRANWVVPADGGRKVIQLSKHANKAAAFAMAGAPGGAAPFGQQLAGAGVGAGAAAFGAGLAQGPKF